MKLTDHSHVKRTEKVTVPLNGVNYHCVPDVPADLIMGMAPTDAEDVKLPEGVTMDDVASMEGEVRDRLRRAGADNIARMRDFLRDVMEPDSWETWQTNLRRLADGATPAQRRKHQQAAITMPQMTLVFRDLVKYYAGRPTEPSSPSSSGADGTPSSGGNSTEPAPAEA